MTIVDYFSLVPVQIILSFGQNEIARATGFIYNRNGSNYLITNWHVLSGRNAETGLCLDTKQLCIPDAIQIDFHADPTGSKWLSPKKEIKHQEEAASKFKN